MESKDTQEQPPLEQAAGGRSRQGDSTAAADGEVDGRRLGAGADAAGTTTYVENGRAWGERVAEICRRHADVTAVFESPSGRLALLLRYTLVPLDEERDDWRARIHATTRALFGELRAAGFRERMPVIQFLSFEEADDIMATWQCRFDQDPARRVQLARTARRYALDRRFLDTRATHRREAAPVRRVVIVGDGHEDRHCALWRWYGEMARTWLSVTPVVRRHLMLAIHLWITAHVVGNGRVSPRPVVASDLADDGPLARSLMDRIPDDEREEWRPWIRLVLADLRQALLHHPGARNEMWVRWLFLIPYSIAAPRRAPTWGQIDD